MRKKYIKEKNKFYRKIIIEPLQRNNVKEIPDEKKEEIIKTKKKLAKYKIEQQKTINVDNAHENLPINTPSINRNKIKHKSLYKKMGKIEPLYKGSTIFIIGGGPSLSGFDFKKLNGKITIAVNKAFLFHPNSNILYWTDARFYKWYEKDIINFKGLKITNKPKPVRHDIINLQDTGRDGLETNTTGIRHGNNSGYAAMNLAVHFGAKRIVLLGYDMKFNGKQSHWHDGYSTPSNERIYQRSMLPYFEGLVKPLAQLGIEVYNANPNSSINLWTKIELKNALTL